MARATLNWTAGGGGNSTGQRVDYKQNSSATWLQFGGLLSPSANTVTVTGLLDNVIYDFRIVNLCSDGGPTNSPVDTKVLITCPSVTYTDLPTSIAYQFSHLGGDVTKYVVELLNAAGTAVLDTKTHLAPSGTIASTFTGLTPSTNYGVRITVYAGTSFQFAKTCPVSNRTTAAPNPCNAPTNVVATMESDT